MTWEWITVTLLEDENVAAGGSLGVVAIVTGGKRLRMRGGVREVSLTSKTKA